MKPVPALCVHCEMPLRNKRTHTYPASGAVAHFVCVSQPSAAETDDLLVLIAKVSQTKKRYAYSTG